MDGIPGVACLFVLPMGKERCRGGVKEVGVIRRGQETGDQRPDNKIHLVLKQELHVKTNGFRTLGTL